MQEKKSAEIAIVTGASSGIGRATALRLAKDGYFICVHYNQNKKGAESTLAAIKEGGGDGDLLQFDVKDPKAIDAGLERFTKLHQRAISILINNAGIRTDGLLGLMSDENFDDVMKTNTYGPFYLMRWCIRKMISKRAGTIVNISSLAGQIGNAGQINYSASKAALIAMTRSLSLEVGSRGIRVNAVAPGLIETEMISGTSVLEELKSRIPLGRIGSTDDVAGCVSFLCSKDSSYITGQTISVNGGLNPS